MKHRLTRGNTNSTSYRDVICHVVYPHLKCVLGVEWIETMGQVTAATPRAPSKECRGAPASLLGCHSIRALPNPTLWVLAARADAFPDCLSFDPLLLWPAAQGCSDKSCQDSRGGCSFYLLCKCDCWALIPLKLVLCWRRKGRASLRGAFFCICSNIWSPGITAAQ